MSDDVFPRGPADSGAFVPGTSTIPTTRHAASAACGTYEEEQTMSDFVIMTDSSCDLPASLAEEMELTVLPLTYYIEDKVYTNYLDEREIAFSEIYAKLRTKCPAKTSAVNMNDFMAPMESLLSAGKDVL